MKIALVSSGSGSRGGGEIYLRFLAEGLVAAGHEVVALVPEAPRMDELAAGLMEVASVRRFAFLPTYDRRSRTLGAFLDRRQQGRLARELGRLPVDIVHVNQQVAEDGLDLVFAASACGRPWLSTVHVGHSAKALGARFGALRDALTARAFRRVGGDLIAVSGSSRDHLATRLAARAHVVLNGVPMQGDAELAEARRRARADWGATATDVVVGTVGRIEAQKAPTAFVDHLLPFAGASTELRLVWIGDGSRRDALLDHAAPHAATMPVLVDGWRADAASRLAGFDVFVLPSLFEGLPLALLEAMHAGVPVVASRADGIAEAIVEGETGLTCETPAEWQTALSAMLRDPAFRGRVGAEAQRSARERFSTAAMAQGTLDVYARVLKGHAMGV